MRLGREVGVPGELWREGDGRARGLHSAGCWLRPAALPRGRREPEGPWARRETPEIRERTVAM